MLLLFTYECKLSCGDILMWWGHSNTICCNRSQSSMMQKHPLCPLLPILLTTARVQWATEWIFHYLMFTTCKWSCRKVMFHRCLSVILLRKGEGEEGVSMWPLPRHGTYPLLSYPQTLDLDTYSPLPPPLWTWDPGPPLCCWHLVVISGHLFKLVHLRTYSHQYWHLVATEHPVGTSVISS